MEKRYNGRTGGKKKTINEKLKNPTYATLAILAHIFALFFVCIYAFMDDSNGGNNLPPVHIDYTTTPSSLHRAHKKTGSVTTSSVIDIDGDTMFIFTSIFALILLCLSWALELTWPTRNEGFMIVIILWVLVGHFTHPHPVSCEASIIMDAASVKASGPTIEVQVTTPEPVPSTPKHVVINVPINSNHTPIPIPAIATSSSSSNNTNETSVQQQDEKEEAVVNNDTKKRRHVVQVEEEEEDDDDDDDRDVLSVIASSFSAMSHPCGWGQINMYFSLLCVFSSLLSLLCDVESRALSLFFRITSLFLTVLIFFMPIACNRFRMTSVGLLITKITLYNIVWNMLRYRRVIQYITESSYRRSIVMMKKYGPIFEKYDIGVVELEQLLRNKNKQLPKPHLIPRPQLSDEEEYYTSSEEEDGEEDEDGEDFSEEYGYNDATVINYGRHGGGDTKRRYNSNVNILKSLSVDSPSSIFRSLDHIYTIVLAAKKKHRRLDTLKKIPVGRSSNTPLLLSNSYNDAATENSSIQSRYERTAPQQMHNFEQLYRIKKKYTQTWCCSWKNRHYNERIIHLIDVTRTIWILAMCPFHPLLLFFLGIVVVALLGYFIRIDIGELNDTSIAIDRMNLTHSSLQ